MPKPDFSDLCIAIRRCIDDLNTLLEKAENLDNNASDDCGDRATRTAYNRVARQLTARQSELEDRIKRLKAEESPMSETVSNEVELVWSQLEKSSQVVCRDAEERVRHIQDALDSKRDKTQGEK